MMDEDIEYIVEKIADLQFCIQEMAIDYFCFDYKIITFYMMNPYTILEHIVSNINLVADEVKVKELIDQVQDFIDYYKVSEDDVYVLHESVKVICGLLGVDVGKYDLVTDRVG